MTGRGHLLHLEAVLVIMQMWMCGEALWCSAGVLWMSVLLQHKIQQTTESVVDLKEAWFVSALQIWEIICVWNHVLSEYYCILLGTHLSGINEVLFVLQVCICFSINSILWKFILTYLTYCFLYTIYRNRLIHTMGFILDSIMMDEAALNYFKILGLQDFKKYF